MKPGATTLPAASMVRLRGAVVRLPMAAIFPSRMPTSPEYQGEPVPSMMWPLVMTRSKAVVDCAGSGEVAREAQRDREHEIQFVKLHWFSFSTKTTLWRASIRAVDFSSPECSA